MKKLGLAVAIVLGMAGAAQAQTTQVITATANIDQVLTLSAVDSIFECGTVNYASTTCDAAAKATVKVTANSAWSLTMKDNASTTTNIVRMTNSARAGSFDIALNWASGGTCAGATCTGTATPSTGVNIDIDDPAASITTGTTGSVSVLATDDQYGPYTGAFTVTLAATN